ncbi:uncharacterized protein LOC128273453 [Anopheles cruzii]|uniref:uncharacterized protein LOC128273453 n=1 Tax=Anopheles cruzii TaxID=68878 RepID=UPI0022EC50CE|nr:uncharacterized protein LOC128273453 [Anopheles cruzii]
MLLLALRSFFFVTILLGYSTGIWRLINDYFRREFETFLQEEAKANKYLLQDPHPSELARGAATAGVPAPPASTTPLPPVAGIAPVTSSGLEVGHTTGADEQEWLRYWRRRAASEGDTTEPPSSDSGSEPQFCSAQAAPRQGLPPESEGRMAVPEVGC